ncbi:4-alpha-glucanotransferase, partial [Vibrio halioticoli]|uniref:4-alpha-glucanotransferase n=1 Tax=Vibrio halioticoli TaxID=71388 RepID=UPI0005871C20
IHTQLYSLRSETNWGIGDLSDLCELISQASSLGANFIGINPIHSSFPANPNYASPYSSSSRYFLNFLYLDITEVPEYPCCEKAKELVESRKFKDALSRLKNHPFVQYDEVAQIKLIVLRALFEQFQTSGSLDRKRAFQYFIKSGGQRLRQQVTFDALHWTTQQSRCQDVTGWYDFPETMRQYHSSDVEHFQEQNELELSFWSYLLWCVEEQFTQVQCIARQSGMSIGVMTDLAVGASRRGAERWADEGTLCRQMNLGTPPDDQYPLGQNWGVAPFNPLVLKTRCYEDFIALLRANMRFGGALRIDHALSLFRQWFIPRNYEAKNGIYVYSDAEDMLSILALESHRQQCTILGEDIGDITADMRAKFDEFGLYGYRVWLGETTENSARLSLSVLSTHDTPTLSGFWHGKDIDFYKKIAKYSTSEYRLCKAKREQHKQSLLSQISLQMTPKYKRMSQKLMTQLHLHVASKESALFSFQLEDWLGMETPVNIPSTSHHYSNWRRKLVETTQNVFNTEEFRMFCHELSSIREQ